MSFLLRCVLGVAVASVACSASTADAPIASESNLGEADVLPTGPLTPDATFANGGTLTLDGTAALALSARADGAIALVRERVRAGEGHEIVVSLIKPDGSATDVVLPGIDHLAKARVLPQGDGLLIIGAGTRYYAARIGADGALDPSFMPDPLDVVPSDVALDASGRILVAGSLGASKAVVVRLGARGGVDTTFAGGRGAWIEAKEGTSSASFLALDEKGAINFASVHDDGPAVLRLDANGEPIGSFGTAGKVALPKNGRATFGLVAGEDGALTYYGPTEDSADVHSFAITKSGKVTPGDKLDGVLFDARSQVSAVTTGEKCSVHVATATTDLTAAECAGGVSYVALGGGKRAIAVTTATGVALRVFAP